jgi:hypothetical protein
VHKKKRLVNSTDNSAFTVEILLTVVEMVHFLACTSYRYSSFIRQGVSSDTADLWYPEVSPAASPFGLIVGWRAI